MPKNLPSHVVMDTRDGFIFFREKSNKAFTKETAHDYADLLNTAERNKPFVACKLVLEFSK